MEEIRTALTEAIKQRFPDVDDFEILLERPRDRSHGDYASNAALILAGKVGKKLRDVAVEIEQSLSPIPTVSKVEVAGPGFINFTLSLRFLQDQVRKILVEGANYGKASWGQGKKVLIEFVSANPVGPLHVGHGRWAAIGDALTNILAASGFEVSKEFYLNDRGRQMNLFAASLEARYAELLGIELAFPEDGYKGSYLTELAQEIHSDLGDGLWQPEDQRLSRLKAEGYKRMVAHIRDSLERFGVQFDVWFSEESLFEKGEVDQALDVLKNKGEVYEADGALWLATSKYGDAKDRVLIRENSEPTYFASDIAYHLDKLTRGFDHLINIWGADHHGYVERVKSSLQALGYDPGVLDILIGQLVNLLRRGEPVRMSKRSGEMITFNELIDEVGTDAARFIFLSRSLDTALDFDMELAKEQTSENPVYYVQYAHARIAGILREAEARGHKLLPVDEADLTVLEHPAERDLIDFLSRFPEKIKEAAEKKAPQALVHYATKLAETFHVFYTQCRVLAADTQELTQARLQLTAAAKQVLQNTLALMGISAPDRM